MARWLPCPGFPDYAVSDEGEVMRGSSARGATPGAVLRPRPNNRGYMLVYLYAPDGTRRNQLVHRLVAEAFLGPIPLGRECNHMNRDRADNRLANLELITHSENLLYSDAVRPRGESHKNAKLTADSVRQIRQRFASGELQRVIAKELGISRGNVSAIVRGRLWQHVKEEA